MVHGQKEDTSKQQKFAFSDVLACRETHLKLGPVSLTTKQCMYPKNYCFHPLSPEITK